MTNKVQTTLNEIRKRKKGRSNMGQVFTDFQKEQNKAKQMDKKDK